MGNWGSAREDAKEHSHTVEMMTTDTERWIPGYEDAKRGYLGTAAIVYLTTGVHGAYGELKQALLRAHGLDSSDVKHIRISYTIGSGSVALFEITNGTPLTEIITSEKVKFVFRVLKYRRKVRNGVQPKPRTTDDLSELEAITRNLGSQRNSNQNESTSNVQHYTHGMQSPPLKKTHQIPNFNTTQEQNHYQKLELPRPANNQQIPNFLTSQLQTLLPKLQNEQSPPPKVADNEIPDYMSMAKVQQEDESLDEVEDLDKLVNEETLDDDIVEGQMSDESYIFNDDHKTLGQQISSDDHATLSQQTSDTS